MGRRKLEMKRIEDKSSRLVTFSKRRAGLVSKARHLSVLCDADVAAIVFSARGKLYEFSSGTANSVEKILSRYQKSCLEAGEMTTKGAGENLQQEPLLQCKRFQTCKELLNVVDRLTEDNNVEELSVNEMTELEQELDTALMQTRLRKTQMKMDYISNLQQKDNKLTEENQELGKQVAAAASAKENGDDDCGCGCGCGLNNLATNQISSPQLTTLPLFNG